jgi:GTP pyrophosphokinase
MHARIDALLASFQHPDLDQALKIALPCIANLDDLAEKLDILLSISHDPQVVAALILSNLDAETEIIPEQFSHEIPVLLSSIQQFGFIQGINSAHLSNPERHHEGLRKMLLSLSQDIRVVFMILADRLYQMRQLKYHSQDKQRTLAEETRQIYAPLANRLGMWAVKWELEDLSFRYLEPEAYQAIARQLAETRDNRNDYIQHITSTLEHELHSAGIVAEISGRPKHIYSIFRKMQRKHLDFSQLYDLRAVRIMVHTVSECYTALGIVHNLWTPIPKEFDDYISNPKSNNYQSLHTAVRALEGKVIEVQIRTFRMHEFAESGVAAHWRYKENVKFDASFEARVRWLRQLINWKDELSDATVGSFRDELADQFIYVLTPDGEVIELPEGATALDFAYKLHSELGHKTRGAKADGSIIALTTPLKTGQHIEILTTKVGEPSRDWMNPNTGYLVTASARAKVRSWFRRHNLDESIASGQQILHRETRRLAVNPPLDILIKRFRCQSENDLYARIGLGDISGSQLAGAFQQYSKEHEPEPTPAPRNKKPTSTEHGDFIIAGVGSMLTHIAPCCNPLPGDGIVGYITQGRGVSVHREDCDNLIHLTKTQPHRILAVEWARANSRSYDISLNIDAYPRADLVRDITTVLSQEHLKVFGINTQHDKQQHTCHLTIDIEVDNLEHLSRALDKINQVKNVIDAWRA